MGVFADFACLRCASDGERVSAVSVAFARAHVRPKTGGVVEGSRAHEMLTKHVTILCGVSTDTQHPTTLHALFPPARQILVFAAADGHRSVPEEDTLQILPVPKVAGR